MLPRNNWIYLWKRNQWEKKRNDMAFGEKHITYAVDGQTFRMIRRLMTGAEAGLERLLQ